MRWKRIFLYLAMALIVVIALLVTRTVIVTAPAIISPQGSAPQATVYSNLDYQHATQYLNESDTPARQTAWIPDWGIWDGIDSLQTSSSEIDAVSPVWYYLNEDGSTKSNLVGVQELVAAADNYGIDVIPSIANFDPDSMHALLSDQGKLDAHLQTLISDLEIYDYAGLDLDYESIYLTDQVLFLQFVKTLSEELHNRDKILTIAVISKWTDDAAYTSLTQTRKGQQWQRLGEYIDELRIMAYDYNSPKAVGGGPVAPIDWQEATIRYALRYLPAEKISIGGNLYGYVWADSGDYQQIYSSYLETSYSEDTQAYSLTSAQLKNRRDYYWVNDLPQSTSGEDVFVYHKDGGDWRAYAPGEKLRDMRWQLVDHYGIAGVALWKLGGEDPDLLMTNP